MLQAIKPGAGEPLWPVVELSWPSWLDLRVWNTPGSSNIAGWNMAPDWVDVFPIKNGDIPACYVSLPEGNCKLLMEGGNHYPPGTESISHYPREKQKIIDFKSAKR